MNKNAKYLFACALTVAQRITPKRGHAVVYAQPATEGNAVEIVRGLSRRYHGDIYWLFDAEPSLRLTDAPSNVHVLPRSSLTALWKYLTAEIVFFTHGLYGSVIPSRRQTIVNLWHGDGMKFQQPQRRSKFPSTYVSGGTAVLTAKKARDFHVPATSALVHGNPRVDQFGQAVPASFWEAIGIDPGDPFVVWMPTFRTSSRTGALPGWRPDEVEPESPDALMPAVVAQLAARGIPVVAKLHQQDAESRTTAGVTILDPNCFVDHATSVYAFLGKAAGLVTDFSSVWTDFLVLDRPIGFVMPDEDAYRRGRGVYPPDILDHLPGPKIADDAAAAEFAADVAGGGAETAALRAETVAWVGLAHIGSATDGLLEALDVRGSFARSGGIAPVLPHAAGAPELTFARR